MRPARATFGTAARRLAALALGLWLSGAGCLACCERTGAATHAGPEAEAAAHHLLAAARKAGRAAPGARVEAPPAAMPADHSCCQARVGSRARREAPEAQGDAPPAAPSETPEAVGARRETVPGGACCRRVLQTAEQARKARVEPAPAHAPSSAARPAAAVPAREQTLVAARPRVPDRGGTYLRCRTLLI